MSTTTVAPMKFKIKATPTKDANTLTFTPTESIAPAAVAAVPAKKAVDPMALLLQNQMNSFVAKMTAQGTLNGEGQAAALAQVKEMMSTINIPAVPARTRTKKVVPAENRCMARVWGGGCGTQCTFSRKPGCGDYCSRCHKMSIVTSTPLQFSETGKHIGLFWGRIDQPKPIMSDGHVVVQWKDPACAEKVTQALAGGATFHPFSGEAKKKVKGPRKPRGAKKSKAKKPKARRAKNAFFWFLGETRAAKKAELIAAAAEGEKVGVADVTKALGAVWKSMDETARAPYVAMEKEDKAKAQQELEASLATINEAVVEESNLTVNTDVPIPAGLGNDEVGQILAQGIAATEKTVAPVEESLDNMISGLSDETVVNTPSNDGVPGETLVEEEEEDDEDGESVEEHTLADGTTYYLGSDGTLYDTESHEIAGTLNTDDNTLIAAH